jgi:hypothetical protein
MQATNRAKELQKRRERQYRISQGLEVSDDEEAETPSQEHLTAASGSKGSIAVNSAFDNKTAEVSGLPVHADDSSGPNRLIPDIGDGANDQDEEDVGDADSRPKNGKKGPKSGRSTESEDGTKTRGKRKYLSLRERKREARKMAKHAKEEGDAFMYGRTSRTVEKSRGGEASFGEVADAPPTITLKRKSGGKGAKPVPVAESGHKIAGSKGAGNRQAQIFKELIQTAQGENSRSGKKSAAMVGVGLRREAEMKVLREQVIAEYRQMRGRPMNNGRSAALAVDPSRLFSATASTSAANIRRDAGK